MMFPLIANFSMDWIWNNYCCRPFILIHCELGALFELIILLRAFNIVGFLARKRCIYVETYSASAMWTSVSNFRPYGFFRPFLKDGLSETTLLSRNIIQISLPEIVKAVAKYTLKFNNGGTRLLSRHYTDFSISRSTTLNIPSDAKMDGEVVYLLRFVKRYL